MKESVHGVRCRGPIPAEAEDEGATGPAALFHSFMDCESGGPTSAPSPRVKPDSYRSVKINFYWRGFAMTLSFEIHIEFTTLTAIIDMSERRTTRLLSKQRKRDPLHQKIERTLLTISAGKRASKVRNTALHAAAYSAIWERFDEEVLANISLKKLLGERILDFRGLVVEAAPRRSIAKSLVGRRLIFTKPYSQPRWSSGFDKQHEPRCDLSSLEIMHPFLKCSLPDDTEFTVSTMLDNRAYLAAALGRQSGIEDHADPLTYFIYEDTLNAWQLGRLVYRINRAGTARIAATIHFDDLRKAGDALLRAANRLDDALSDPASPNDATREGLKNSTEKIRKFHREVEDAVAKLPGKEALDGSLYYRVERSQYYQSQFERVTKSLRIGRVEGYQQYDEFVGQRLGPAYEYITRLGSMYGRVQSDRSLLLRRLQAQDALYEEKQISRFQETAEIALFLVLGPYYAASVFEHVVAIPAATRAIWAAALAWGVISFIFYRLLKNRPWKIRLGSALFAGWVAALAIGGLILSLEDKNGSAGDADVNAAARLEPPEPNPAGH